jgi:hypothetical protein
VKYARNAGKVDGKDAVAARASLQRAAGKLVATTRRGPHRGTLPGKFVAGVPRATPFNRVLDVTDNSAGVPVTLFSQPGFGTLLMSCNDQSPTPGVENPIAGVAVTNTSGGALNLARRQGNDRPIVKAFANGTVESFAVEGQNLIEVILGRPDGTILQIHAGLRQAGQRTAAAACAVFGSAQVISR